MPIVAEPIPRAPRRPAPFVLTLGSRETGMGLAWNAISTSGSASAAYPSANLLIAYPFVLDAPATARRLWWYNGATASGNVDIAILAENGDRLVSSGSTAQSGTSALQIANTADLDLAPDTLYHVAIAVDNTTATLFRWTAANANVWRVAGLREAASSFAIPSTNTLATIATNYLPVMGIDLRGVM